MSIIVFAGASQVMSVGMLVQGASVPAIILSWLKMPIILVVIGAILSDMAVYMIM